MCLSQRHNLRGFWVTEYQIGKDSPEQRIESCSPCISYTLPHSGLSLQLHPSALNPLQALFAMVIQMEDAS